MEKIIDLHEDFYKSIQNDLEVKEKLEREKITILYGFIENRELVRLYYQAFYISKTPRIVLCGINPGKNGAGKTGIPFIDFNGASELFPNVDQDDKERSAQFILSVISEIGKMKFHKNVYMTNLSWFGFIQDNKNMNYFDLPTPLESVFTDSFLSEMEIVRPKMIIPLSKDVEQALNKMTEEGRLNYPVGPRLPHPYYCSFGKREDKYKEKYVNRITSSMGRLALS